MKLQKIASLLTAGLMCALFLSPVCASAEVTPVWYAPSWEVFLEADAEVLMEEYSTPTIWRDEYKYVIRSMTDNPMAFTDFMIEVKDREIDLGQVDTDAFTDNLIAYLELPADSFFVSGVDSTTPSIFPKHEAFPEEDWAELNGKLLLYLDAIDRVDLVTLRYPEGPLGKPGDLNWDSQVSVLDTVLLQKAVCAERPLTEEEHQHADLNRDGRVNVIDLTLLKRMLLSQ